MEWAGPCIWEHACSPKKILKLGLQKAPLMKSEPKKQILKWVVMKVGIQEQEQESGTLKFLIKKKILIKIKINKNF